MVGPKLPAHPEFQNKHPKHHLIKLNLTTKDLTNNISNPSCSNHIVMIWIH